MSLSVASNFRDAQQKLSTHPYNLLFVDPELPGGSWQRLLQWMMQSGKHCEVIVCSRCGDEQLWAEVLQCGAYDLISEPYEQREVARIAQCALESHYLSRYGSSYRQTGAA
jgi:two-component system repressor protein LuxO